MNRSIFTMNLSLILCIISACLCITRVILYFYRMKIRLNNKIYVLWCFCETIIMTLFISLYLALMLKGAINYYEILSLTFVILICIVIFPYIFLFLGLYLYYESRDNDRDSRRSKNPLIRFFDEHKKLKLIISPSAILYLQSEENYVHIFYLDKMKVKNYILRSSMKALENNLQKNGLIRCHRSFFINPEHVKLVRKDSTGQFFAQLNQDGFDDIPISKSYYPSVSAVL